MTTFWRQKPPDWRFLSLEGDAPPPTRWVSLRELSLGDTFLLHSVGAASEALRTCRVYDIRRADPDERPSWAREDDELFVVLSQEEGSRRRHRSNPLTMDIVRWRKVVPREISDDLAVRRVVGEWRERVRELLDAYEALIVEMRRTSTDPRYEEGDGRWGEVVVPYARDLEMLMPHIVALEGRMSSDAGSLEVDRWKPKSEHIRDLLSKRETFVPGRKTGHERWTLSAGKRKALERAARRARKRDG